MYVLLESRPVGRAHGSLRDRRVLQTRLITDHGKSPLIAAVYHVIAPSNDGAITSKQTGVM